MPVLELSGFVTSARLSCGSNGKYKFNVSAENVEASKIYGNGHLSWCNELSFCVIALSWACQLTKHLWGLFHFRFKTASWGQTINIIPIWQVKKVTCLKPCGWTVAELKHWIWIEISNPYYITSSLSLIIFHPYICPSIYSFLAHLTSVSICPSNHVLSLSSSALSCTSLCTSLSLSFCVLFYLCALDSNISPNEVLSLSYFMSLFFISFFSHSFNIYLFLHPSIHLFIYLSTMLSTPLNPFLNMSNTF